MWENRRLHPRIEVQLPAEYRIRPSDPPLAGTMANLSVGGAALRTARQIPPRSVICQLRFTVPADGGEPEALETSAVLVHAHPFKSDQGTIAYESGVHFLGFGAQTFERLQRFLAKRLESESKEPNESN